MPPERQGGGLNTAGQQSSEEVAVQPLHAVEVNRVFIDPQPLHDRFLTGAAQGQEECLIRIGNYIAGARPGVGDYRDLWPVHTAPPESIKALGIRGEVTESARPSAARR